MDKPFKLRVKVFMSANLWESGGMRQRKYRIKSIQFDEFVDKKYPVITLYPGIHLNSILKRYFGQAKATVNTDNFGVIQVLPGAGCKIGQLVYILPYTYI